MANRFILFLSIMMFVIFGNILLGHLLNPPPAPAPNEQVQAPVKPGDDKAADAAGEGKVAEADGAAPRPPDEESAAEQPIIAELPEIAAPPEVPEQYVSLGSVDAATGYRALVTFTNQGAAVERWELASDRFRDLDDRTGYLGHLATKNVPKRGGVEVRVVGHGTPAAAAGLQVGDVIVSVDGQEIQDNDSLRGALLQTKPRETVEVRVLRDGAPATLSATLVRRPLEVVRPEIDNYRSRRDVPPAGFTDPNSFLLTLKKLGDKSLEQLGAVGGELAGVDLMTGNWEVVDHSQSHVVFSKTLPAAGLEVRKHYHLAKAPPEFVGDETYTAYHLTFDIEIRNIGQDSRELAYQLDGPNGLPTEGWWYGSKISRNWSGVGIRDVFTQFEGGSPTLFSATSIADGNARATPGASIMFAGVDAQYFSSVLIPQKEDVKDVWFQEVEMLRVGGPPDARFNKMLTNVTVRLTSKAVELAPGEELKHSFVVFGGPKRPDLLANYQQPSNVNYNLSELVYYGWSIWAGVAKVMSKILHALYVPVQNYGLAILLLTVLVRGAMFPLSRKQAMNMIKMQELQPEIVKIQEKYKKDLEKRTKAQQDLFRKHKYNPMGGCMLMLLQLPIFIGLYRALMVDIELRQASLFGDAIRWCSNLAAPDMLFDWSGVLPEFLTRGVGIFVLGPYFNVLPIVTVALFIVQQKMFMPPPANEQAAMQQKMMKYMMVFIGLLFYKVASGLCLYFIASTLWGVCERKILPKVQKPDEQEPKPAPTPEPVSSNGHKSTGGGKKKRVKR